MGKNGIFLGKVGEKPKNFISEQFWKPCNMILYSVKSCFISCLINFTINPFITRFFYYAYQNTLRACEEDLFSLNWALGLDANKCLEGIKLPAAAANYLNEYF